MLLWPLLYMTERHLLLCCCSLLLMMGSKAANACLLTMLTRYTAACYTAQSFAGLAGRLTCPAMASSSRACWSSSSSSSTCISRVTHA